MLENIQNGIDFAISLPFLEWFVRFALTVTVILIFELHMKSRYQRLAEEAAQNPTFAPIHFSGAIAEDFRTGANTLLIIENSQIASTYKTIREEQGFQNTLVSIGKEFGEMMALVSASLNVIPFVPSSTYEVGGALKEVKIKMKFFEAPLLSLYQILIWVIDQIPAPNRKSYLALRVHISITSVGDQIKLLVFRNPGYRAGSQGSSADNSFSLTHTQEKGESANSLLRNAVCMAHQLHGKAFPGLKWKSIRFFTDALDHLNEYRKYGKPKDLKAAKENFESAANEDSNNHEAQCFLGYILVAARKPETILAAINCFEKAQKKDENNELDFNVFVLTGLAHSYLQLYHRGGERTKENLREAREYFDQAKETGQGAKLNAWISYIGAVVQVVDEGEGLQIEEMKKRFIVAAELALGAMRSEEDNALYYNLMGWIMLKLAERGVDNLSKEEVPSTEIAGNPAEISERYLQRSLRLNKQNKLSHANLCLLYATPHFLNKPKSQLYVCRHHGLEAVEIDPEYTNGYRDLTVSLMRYGEFDEAHSYYVNALELAEGRKDFEIVDTVDALLDELNEGKKEGEREDKHRWKKENLPKELFEPHSKHQRKPFRRDNASAATPG